MLSLLPSRFWKGRELIAIACAIGALLKSGSDMGRLLRKAIMARRSMTPTPISTLALSRGFLTRAGTTAHPQCSLMRRCCSLTTSVSSAFLVIAVLQLSGARIGVEPPKNENMCARAAIHASSSVLQNPSACRQSEQGRHAASTYAFRISPVSGPIASPASPTQPTRMASAALRSIRMRTSRRCAQSRRSRQNAECMQGSSPLAIAASQHSSHSSDIVMPRRISSEATLSWPIAALPRDFLLSFG